MKINISDIVLIVLQFEVAMRQLPFQQQVKIMQKKFTLDAKTALANQLLQRFISCLCLGTHDQSKLQFKQNQYGKPYLVDSDFSFSMSNQQGYTSMVISLVNEEIGIDLASCSDVDKFGVDYLEHFHDIFHPEEFQILQGIKSSDDLKLIFTEYWALKESYTKKLGVGLNGDLASYNFTNVPKLHSTIYTETPIDDTLQIHHPVSWNNSTKLSLAGEPHNIDIHLAIIPNTDIVLSICGKIPEDPLLIRTPISLITKYLS